MAKVFLGKNSKSSLHEATVIEIEEIAEVMLMAEAVVKAVVCAAVAVHVAESERRA